MRRGEPLTKLMDDRGQAAGAGVVMGALAVVLGRGTFGEWPPWWASLLVVALCAVIVAFVPEWERCGEPFASIQVATTLGAVYLCVPEPRDIALFLALVTAYAALQMAAATPPAIRLTIPLSTGLLAAAGLTGAAKRESAYVGVVVAMAALLVLPLVHLRYPAMSRRAAYAVVAVTSVAVVVAARTIGISGT